MIDRINKLSDTKRRLLKLNLSEAAGITNAIDNTAIIGMACRFPEAHDLKTFWNNLRQAKNSVREINNDRFKIDECFEPGSQAPGKISAKWGGLLEDIKGFDPQFFNISPREAERMDPQQRLLLEVTWEALENANLTLKELRKYQTGVFIGVGSLDYNDTILAKPEMIDGYMVTGCSHSAIAGRLSYFLDINGPSLSLDTGCSSSLVALHYARQSLLAGDCEIAIVGGVNVISSVRIMLERCKANMLSVSGGCKAFDAAADGYTPGEGCGVIVLKRSERALADSNLIWATIKSTAINQDGLTSSLMAPNGPAQEAVITQALHKADLTINDIDYIEAHGTGTLLGDPIEVQALANIASKKRSAAPLLIGSVKSNIGHLEAAAGMASLIKVVLAMYHGEIPKSLHFNTPNPHIDWQNMPIKVVTKLTPWQAVCGKRRVGISSFSFIGTNAHVILEQDEKMSLRTTIKQHYPANLLVWSAKSKASLKAKAQQFIDYLSENSTVNLQDICANASLHREHFKYRAALVGSSISDIMVELKKISAEIDNNTCQTVSANLNNESVVALEAQLSQHINTANKINQNEWQKLLISLADHYVNGDKIDWQKLYPDGTYCALRLPTYAFNHQPFWFGQSHPKNQEESVDLLGKNVALSEQENYFEILLSIKRLPVLKEHLLFGTAIVSGPTQLAILLEACRVNKLSVPYQITHYMFFKPISIALEQERKIRLHWVNTVANKFEISFKGSETQDLVTYSGGKLSIHNEAISSAVAAFDFELIKNRASIEYNADEFFNFLEKQGYQFGESFKLIQHVWCGENEVLSLLKKSNGSGILQEVDPGLLDSCIQSMIIAAPAKLWENNIIFVPQYVAEFIYHQQITSDVYCYVKIREVNYERETFEADLVIFNEQKQILISIKQLRLKKARPDTLLNQDSLVSATPVDDLMKITPVVTDIRSIIDNELLEQVEKKLIQFAAKALNIAESELNNNSHLGEFGFESFSFIDFITQVNACYSLKLTAAILFEHNNLDSFAKYLLAQHALELNRFYKQAYQEVNPSENLHLKQNYSFHSNNITSVNTPTKEIAIIGISGLFPGSSNLEIFWDNLLQQKNLISEVPATRWDYHLYEDQKVPKWGGFIKDVDKFDAEFFNISPREAELMDPQQRLLLETVWHAIEDAGYNVEKFNQYKTGLFVGVSTQDYQELLQYNNLREAHTSTGTAHSILANRISYLLNLTGTSEAVDTACSSSLVALHRAIRAIEAGDCRQAIVGGVNALLTPTLFISFAKAGMLSSDGCCKTFDKSANGYVRAEGVGAIILKPLHLALADDDHIYGVIKASGVNHGGHVSSLTAPNPNAQAELIIDACQQGDVTPDSISYIEMHGTGTALGDPIEVNGLKKAFKALAQLSNVKMSEKSCGLGTVKSNIGHLEAAAGIAGIIKVLLMFKHKRLIKQAHYHEHNPFIELDNSPFYIVNDNKPWEIKANTKRRAGVSSFGFGGTNAHVILEEPSSISLPQSVSESHYLITLSGKSESALKQRISDLLTWLINHKQDNENSLESISYTLNAGRNHFQWRCALIVIDKTELELKLNQLNTQQKASDCYYGKIDNTQKTKTIDNKTLSELLITLNCSDYNDDFLYHKQLNDLANFYIKGYEIDWAVLYKNKNHQKLSMPTYPFQKEYYWLDVQNCDSEKLYLNNDKLHPLIDQNVSTWELQQFKTLLKSSAFYIKDHIVKEQRILPGVCYLEMARKAGELSQPGSQVTKLQQIVWERPLKIENEKNILVNLQLVTDKIYYQLIDAITETIYGHGIIIYGEPYPIAEKVDLAQLGDKLDELLDKNQLYSNFQKIGLQYGPSLQALQWLKCNEFEALGYINLPNDQKQASDRSAFYLHPSLLDGALQSIVGLHLIRLKQQTLVLPFALEEVVLYSALTDHCYVYAKVRPTIKEHVKQYDLQIFSEAGEQLATLKGLSIRVLSAANEDIQTQPLSKLAYYSSYWEERAINNKITMKNLVAIGFNDQQLDRLKSHLEINVIPLSSLEQVSSTSLINISHVVYLGQKKQDILQNDVTQLFAFAKRLMQARHKAVNLIYLVEADNGMPFSAMAQGLFKSIHQEHPHYHFLLLYLEHSLADRDSMAHLTVELQANHEKLAVVRYAKNKRYVQTIKPLLLNYDSKNVLRHSGVYLITGGLGALGFIIAKYLAVQYKAKLVLTGRSLQDNEKINIIKSLGGEVLYMQSDISQSQQVSDLISTITAYFGNLHGIIHCAGSIKDNLILNKNIDDFTGALAAKVMGAIYLDNATQECDLDYFILFSSIASVTGNAGQSDYASANAFLDAFSAWRNEQVERNNCKGKTIAINWPLWQEGTMQMDTVNRKYWEDAFGLSVLPTTQALNAFEQLITSPASQIIVTYGNADKFMYVVNDFSETYVQDSLEPIPFDLNTPIHQHTLLVKIQEYIKNIMQKVLKLSAHKFGLQIRFEQYGIDSILIVELIRELEKDLGLLPKTLFFEFQTIAELADYFLHEYGNILGKKFIPLLSTPPDELPVVTEAGVSRQLAVDKTYSEESVYDIKDYNTNKDIAIIGLQGRYPQAYNLQEFWDNLLQGKDCVVEIPHERWDWRLNFDEDKSKQGKSYSKWGSFIDGYDKFDPLFFNISPKEAELIDPQERLFLEVSWQTLEDAGYTPDHLKKHKVGVFVGVMYGTYQLHTAENVGSNITSSSYSAIANRVSYYLDLNGPSLAVDTMCSSSLTAIHLACSSINQGDCELALAGGVNITTHFNKYLFLSQGKFLSSDGKCRSFGEGGDGYVPGEGVGAILLKSLSQALADRDHIYGIIRGSSINHGGFTNGFTVPNPNAQSALIAETLKKANVMPKMFSYVESHGTGTSLGDPIEIRGLSKAFDASENIARQSCPIGSVKSNIGHLESAAGIAALTKVLLQLKYKKLVPSLHAENLNSNIIFNKTPFYVQQTVTDWQPKPGYSRLAGISSFGAGGSNAHLIIEEGPKQLLSKQQHKPLYLLVLSAKHPQSLQQRINDLNAYLNLSGDISLEAVAYTLNARRVHFDYRCAIVVASIEELRLTIEQVQQGKKLANFLMGDNNVREEKEPIFQEQLSNILQFLQAENIEQAIYKNKLMALADLYIKNYDIDWETLHQKEAKQRISLPTYSFLKNRYWFNSYKGANHQEQEIKTVTKPPDESTSSNVTNFTSKQSTLSNQEEIVSFQIIDESIAVISMHDKAHKNQLTSHLLNALEHCITSLARNVTIKVIIITGYEDIFCLGGDEETLVAITEQKIKYTAKPFIYQGLLECPIPVIAAMQGHAFGAGFALGLYADIVILSESHLYTANFMQYGITPGVGSTLILQEKLSLSLASEMMWTAREFTGSELKLRGAPMMVTPAKEVLKEALSIASSLSKKPLSALHVFKKTTANRLLKKLPEIIEQELHMHQEVFQSPDARDRIQAYFQKLKQEQFKDNQTDNVTNSTILSSAMVKVTDTLTPITNSLEADLQAFSPVSTDGTQMQIVQSLTGLIAEQLHLEENEIHIKTKFSELGMDSIALVEITQKIKQQYNQAFEAITLYDYPTIERLADFIYKELLKKKQTISNRVLPTPRVDVNMEQRNVTNNTLVNENEQVTATPQIAPLKLKNPATYSPIHLSVVSMSQSSENSSVPINSADIAIVGIAGRFPGADNVESYWEGLKIGNNFISEIPQERWDWRQYYSLEKNKINTSRSKWGGFLADVDKFDPLFFNISPQEAKELSPEIRLMFEIVWKVIEDAGYIINELAHYQEHHQLGIGVFMATMYQHYPFLSNDLNFAAKLSSMNMFSMLANRISHFFDFRGPSITLDTACSGSLTAVHMACESIKNGDSLMAIAGGINLHLHPAKYEMLSELQLISSEEKSKGLGQSDGFVPGEGVGAILLKPLSLAIKDNDNIYGIIKSSAINHGGKTASLALPNPTMQAQAIVQVLKKANIQPRTINYVECAANGAALGDSLEIAALTKAFRSFTDEQQFCAIGSIKSNIGHLEAASGISQLFKVLYQLKYKTLVPSINAEPLNSEITLENTPFYLQKDLSKWKNPVMEENGESKELPRRALISSLGAGGSNAHLILEEYTATSHVFSVEASIASQLFVFSAKNKISLIDLIKNMIFFLERNPEISLANMAYTLQVGRESMSFRLAIQAAQQKNLLERLQHYVENTLTIDDEQYVWSNIEKEANLTKPVSILEILDEKIISSLIQKGDISKIIASWIQGAEIPWKLFYQSFKPSRITLPTYPFEKKSYWIANSHIEHKPINPSNVALDKISVPPRYESEELSTIEHIIIKLLNEAFSLPKEELIITKKFSEYGIDSLRGMRLLNRINHHYKLALEPFHLMENSTIGELTQLIQTILQEKAASQIAISEPIIEKNNFITIDNLDPQPEFIERISIPFSLPANKVKNDELADQKLLANMLAKGIGLWKSGDNLIIEYAKEKDLQQELTEIKIKASRLACILNEHQRYYPLSFSQKMMHVQSELYKNPAYQLVVPFVLNKKLNLKSAEQALVMVLSRHQILRTTFPKINNIWVQVVQSEIKTNIEYIEYCGSDLQQKNLITKLLIDEKGHKFNLDMGPLFRLIIIEKTATQQMIVLNIHHSVCDGVGVTFFINELLAIYKMIEQKTSFKLPKLMANYGHFVLEQHSLNQQIEEKEIKWWQQQLANAPLQCKLPYDYHDNSQLQKKGGIELLLFDQSEKHIFEQFCKKENISLTLLVLTGLYVLLHKWTKQSDIIIGSTLNQRNKLEYETLIGDFINLIPIRVKIDDELSGKQIMLLVQSIFFQVYANQKVTFNKLIQKLNPKRNFSNLPFYNVCLDSLNFSAFELDIHQVEVKSDLLSYIDTFNNNVDPLMDLFFLLLEEEDNFIIGCIYRLELFKQQTIILALNALKEILHSLVARPDDKLSNYVNFKTHSNNNVKLDWQGSLDEKPCQDINLFCLPGGDGSHFVFNRLIGNNLPCKPYAIRYNTTNEKARNSIEETAMDIINITNCFKSPEPFILLGLSYGGLVAFEICQQLKKMNRQMPIQIILLDPPPPTLSLNNLIQHKFKSLLTADNNYLSTLLTINWAIKAFGNEGVDIVSVDQFSELVRGLNESEREEFAYQWIRKNTVMMLPTLGEFKIWLRLLLNNIFAIADYVAEPFFDSNIRVLYIASEDNSNPLNLLLPDIFAKDEATKEAMWKQLLPKTKIDYSIITGSDHYSMFSSTNMKKIENKITDLLQQNLSVLL